MMDDRKNEAEGADEQALRSLLSGAVHGLEPSEGRWSDCGTPSPRAGPANGRSSSAPQPRPYWPARPSRPSCT